LAEERDEGNTVCDAVEHETGSDDYLERVRGHVDLGRGLRAGPPNVSITCAAGRFEERGECRDADGLKKSCPG
jgi:hypothetical protein